MCKTIWYFAIATAALMSLEMNVRIEGWGGRAAFQPWLSSHSKTLVESSGWNGKEIGMTRYQLCVCNWQWRKRPLSCPHTSSPPQHQHPLVQDCLHSPPCKLGFFLSWCWFDGVSRPHPVSAADTNGQIKWGHLFI